MNFKGKVLDYAKISPVILLNGNLTDFENSFYVNFEPFSTTFARKSNNKDS